jgi:hypothetical protein
MLKMEYIAQIVYTFICFSLEVTMKEHIVPKQAIELPEEQFYSLFPEGVVKRDDWANYHHKKVTVGKMMAYLRFKGATLELVMGNTSILRVYNETRSYKFASSELCDALWKAILEVVTLEIVKGSVE